MARNKLEEYDLIKLRKALRLLTEVYGYYYGHNPTRRYWKRLETIINKLEALLSLN